MKRERGERRGKEKRGKEEGREESGVDRVYPLLNLFLFRLAARVGRLHRALRDLTTTLIYTHGLLCDLVLKESGKVLDPSRISRWDNLIEIEKRKQERRQKKKDFY